MPPWIGAPFPRVSTIRQGASPMKGRGLVITPIVVKSRLDLAGLQVAGPGQSAIPCAQTVVAKATTQKPRNRIRRAEGMNPRHANLGIVPTRWSPRPEATPAEEVITLRRRKRILGPPCSRVG